MTLVTSVDLAGTIYSSGVNSPNHMGNQGWRTYFNALVGDMINELGRPATIPSSTSITIGVGAKTFVVGSPPRLYAGGEVVIARASNPTSAWMFGETTVKSHTSIQVTVSRLSSGAGGPFTDWVLSLAAPEPAVGGVATSIALVSSTAGLSVLSGTITNQGTIALALANDTSALALVSSTGYLERMASNSFAVWHISSAAKTAFVGSTTDNIVSRLAARSAVDVQIFSTSGNWAKPNSGSVVYVEAWGGGGGGGGTAPAGDGGSGGGGSFDYGFFRYADLPTSVSVVVAAGGTSAVTSGSNGGSGGTSSFGDYLSAPGGVGGTGGTHTGGPGGAVLHINSGGTSQGGWDAGGGASGAGDAGNSGYGGAGGGTAGAGSTAGKALFGGGGGIGADGAQGTSVHGGAGATNPGSAGVVPGGGGGYGLPSGEGARGEVRVYTF